MSDKIIFFAAVIANIILLCFVAVIFTYSYGSDARLALLLIFPPILSLMALIQAGDIEERRLRKHVRKAVLKKQLKELEEFLK